MASPSIHTYYTSESSSGQNFSSGHIGRAEQEIGPIEETSGYSISGSTSKSAKSESVRLEREVDMSVLSGNAKGVEVSPPDNDWVVTD